MRRCNHFVVFPRRRRTRCASVLSFGYRAYQAFNLYPSFPATRMRWSSTVTTSSRAPRLLRPWVTRVCCAGRNLPQETLGWPLTPRSAYKILQGNLNSSASCALHSFLSVLCLISRFQLSATSSVSWSMRLPSFRPYALPPRCFLQWLRPGPFCGRRYAAALHQLPPPHKLPVVRTRDRRERMRTASKGDPGADGELVVTALTIWCSMLTNKLTTLNLLACLIDVPSAA